MSAVIAFAVWGSIAVAVLIRAGVALERQRRRERAPYSWRCPRCSFDVAGDDPGPILTITRNHEREHRHDQRHPA